MHETSKMQAMSREMGRIENGKRRKICMSSLQNTVIKVITAAIASGIIGAQLIELTTEQRGYFAIGGEWIAIIMFYVMVYSILGNKKSQPKRWPARRKVIIPSSENNFKEGLW